MSRIIRSNEIAKKVPFHDMQLRRMEAAGLFPKRFVISPGGRAVGWLEAEVDAWIEERAASREPVPAAQP